METAKRRIGNLGEEIAGEFLRRKGLKPVAKNWSCKAGEVDLIMRDKETLVFVEVRLRQPTNFGAGLETVAREKQQKLIRTAMFYQQKEGYWGDIRFDVVSIVLPDAGDPEVEHIEYAFEVG